MTTTALWIAAGTLLGALQMGLGIAVGLWVGRGHRQAGDVGRWDEQRAGEVLTQLKQLTRGINQDVRGHRAQLSKISHRLAASRSLGASDPPGASEQDQPTSLTELVVGVVGEMIRANEQLQERLTLAEAQLARQTAEIASHLNRALTDDLTGLPNRRAFDDQLRQRIEAYSQYAIPFSLMLIDIDFFKAVNDTHGHVAGDHVLSEIAAVIRATLRKPDFVARYGGEEFAVILPYTPLEDAVHAARHTRLAIEAATTKFDDQPIRVTASVGMTAMQDGDDAIYMLQRADDALYAAKSGGRNCGYLHDGVRCVRLFSEDPGGGGAEEPRTAGDGRTREPLSPELAAACAELREFAAEHADGGFTATDSELNLAFNAFPRTSGFEPQDV